MRCALIRVSAISRPTRSSLKEQDQRPSCNGPGRCGTSGLRAPARCSTIPSGTNAASRGSRLKLTVLRRIGSVTAPGRTDTSRASTHAYAMNCSTAKSSTRCERLRSELAASLQHDQAACIARLQATNPRGVRACIRRVAGCATSTSFAGHASTEAGLELTLHLDHPMGAHQDHATGQVGYRIG